MTSRHARGFASDNCAGVHPAVLEALVAANAGHVLGYGADEHTRAAEARLAAHFGERARGFLVFGGTAANVLGLRAACRPGQAVICAEGAHLSVDEGGGPEVIAGVKVVTASTEHGKLTPRLVEGQLGRVGDVHAAQPRLVSISQCTEVGTVYTPDEIRALAEHAHAHGMSLHMDGARLSNAAAALGVSLGALTADVGVDILSFGGTKNGLMGAEAVVFLRGELAVDFEYVRKQSLQLASKMRFLAAQFTAFLTDDLWLRCASRSNAMAARLAGTVAGLPGLRITRPVETNVVFATLPTAASAALRESFAFYMWDQARGEVRWMCAWDTTEADVDEFARAVRKVLTQAA